MRKKKIMKLEDYTPENMELFIKKLIDLGDRHAKDEIKIINHIAKEIGVAALYENLAEEAIELAHAALKTARALRNENPTPVTTNEADNHVLEELQDVYLLVLWLYGDFKYDIKTMGEKQARAIRRICEKNMDSSEGKPSK